MNPYKKNHFTLIELLVVVAIIGILASMLLPSLKKAREAGKRAVCANNQKQVGAAMAMYNDSFNDYFPVQTNWATMMGATGDSGTYGGNTPAEDRPLNVFLDDTGKVAECPSDKGDPLNNSINNCFKDIGTSYIIQFNGNTSGIANVTGSTTTVTKLSDWEEPVKKHLTSDWPVHGNRKVEFPATRWHDEKNRRFNVLFLDGHVDFFSFPMSIESMPGNTAPDPSRGYY